MRRILPPALFIIAIAVMSLLHWQWPLAAFVSQWARIPALALTAIGLGLAVLGARLFTRLGTNIKTFDEPGRLVMEGLFNYSRNPMYLGFSIALLGIALALGSASPLIVWAAFVAITDRWYIAFEEEALKKKFGDAYLAYQRRTRRWI